MPQSPEARRAIGVVSAAAMALGSLVISSHAHELPQAAEQAHVSIASEGPPILLPAEPLGNVVGNCRIVLKEVSLSRDCAQAQINKEPRPLGVEFQTRPPQEVTTTRPKRKPVVPRRPTPTHASRSESKPRLATSQSEIVQAHGATLTAQQIAWLQEAGVAESDYPYVDDIFDHESGWNPAAVNPHGCIGLGQNCPQGKGRYWLKDACPDWARQPVCQIKRFAGYAAGRFGSWYKAFVYRRAHNSW